MPHVCTSVGHIARLKLKKVTTTTTTYNKTINLYSNNRRRETGMEPEKELAYSL